MASAQPGGSSKKRNSDEKKMPSIPQHDRQHGRQYFYFYGSTSDGSVQSGGRNGGSVGKEPTSPSVMTHATNETDSLVGECLVPTDNEEETPRNVEGDYRQLLISLPNGSGRLQSLPEHPRQARNSSFQSFLLCCKSYRRLHSRYQLILAVGGTTALIFLSLLFLPERKISWSSQSAANSVPVAQQILRNYEMKFPQVDRGSYDDPVSNFLDSSLFHSSLLNTNNKTTNTAKRVFRFPFPTGAFWTNLVLPPTADRGLSYPVAVYPYAYKWSYDSLEVSYPTQHRKENAKEIHDYFFPDLRFGTSQNITSRKIMAFDPLSVQLRYFVDGRQDSFWETYLVQGSPYITIKYSNASPIIKAFSTFTGLICPREEPKKRTRRQLKFGVCYSNNNTTEQATSRLTTLHGVQFILETQEGVRWIAFSSELIRLEFDTTTRTTITAAAEDGSPFTGVLRFAIIPPTQEMQHGSDGVTTQMSTALDQIECSKGVQRLIYHAGVYPIAGSVSWSFRSSEVSTPSKANSALHSVSGFDFLPFSAASASSSIPSSTTYSTNGRIGTIEFKYATQSFTQTSTTPNLLLMLALPHHAQKLSPSIQLGSDQFDLDYRCIKGPMRPVVGSTWAYDETLPMFGFDGDSGSNLSRMYLDPSVKRVILQNLQGDVTIAQPTSTEDIYGFGKQAARLAQIAHIANNLLDNSTASSSSASGKHPDMRLSADDDAQAIATNVLKQALDVLYHSFDLLLKGKVSDALAYDANMGGLVTVNGLRNPNADFGNGRYNDHHFHYGYLLYAAAILGKLDPSFLESHGDYIDSISYDIAYESNFDSAESASVFFPGARHKIWFDGHSFASGMFPFGNGKSQESSSEAVNAYYGAYLWSLVRNGAADNPSLDDSKQTDFARLLLATELRGAKTYWHMMPPESNSKNQTSGLSIYSPEFSENYMGTKLL